MLILGSCLALNLSYFGCCDFFVSPPCSNNECFCDQLCHILKDCCSDIADIGCHPVSSYSPVIISTPAAILSKTKSEAHASQNV